MNDWKRLLKVDGNKVYYYNGVLLGQVYIEVDGYYVFFFKDDMQGFFSGPELRAIADMLDELNKPWDDQVKKYFEEQKRLFPDN